MPNNHGKCQIRKGLKIHRNYLNIRFLLSELIQVENKLETESDSNHDKSDPANATTSGARPMPKAKVVVAPHNDEKFPNYNV